MKKRNILIASGLTLSVITGSTFGRMPINAMTNSYIQENNTGITNESIEDSIQSYASSVEEETLNVEWQNLVGRYGWKWINNSKRCFYDTRYV